jgi:uncharacterized protein YjbI with pentapeptide repeats
MVIEIEPITRENLLELIRRNGGSAHGLNLSGRTFETAIELSGMHLDGIILDEANLSGSYPPDLNFTGEFLDGRDARTLGAILVGAKLTTASLRNAELSFVNFESADLSDADLREAYLYNTRLRKATLEQCNFTEARLPWADLWEANLRFSNLKKADLSNANLMSSDLLEANLEGAHLFEAELSGANLAEANLSGANMTGVKFDSDTELANVKWGNYILDEEKIGHFEEAVDIYRRLKQWYMNAGIYDVAGEFFFREMTAKRKNTEWSPNPFPRIYSKFLSILCGYGEKYIRVIFSAVTVFVLLAIIYWLFGGLNFLSALYFSGVSFTALGYGGWVNAPPQDWIKGMGVLESFIGVFMMALFLVTFTRKMTR